MAKDLQLELVHDSGTFVFAVEGEYVPRLEPVYRYNVNPPEIVELRQVWEFRQCKLVSSTAAGLWAGAGGVAALVALLSTRGAGHPTSARLVDVGASTTLITLGPADYEKFAFEILEGETDAATPRASWRRTAAFTLRVSAVRKFTDARGIVDFQQTVRVTFPGGLQRIESVMTITTLEGTSAVEKAAQYAALDSTNYGSDYLYETGAGADGIDYEYEDADTLNGRTPTVCVATSAIAQQGVDCGTTGPSGSLSAVLLQTETETTADETITRTIAQAVGPNAESWVVSQRPGGSLSRNLIVREPSSRLVRGEWERKTQRPDSATGETSSTTVEVTITGGGRVYDYEPATGDFEPIEYEGTFIPWVARVAITVERVGGSGRFSELRLPGPPGEPWRLQRDESEEKEPTRVPTEKGADALQARWRREATLVFRSVRAPDEPVSLAMSKVSPVASHLHVGQLT